MSRHMEDGKESWRTTRGGRINCVPLSLGGETRREGIYAEHWDLRAES